VAAARRRTGAPLTKGTSSLALLLAQPQRFHFDAAARVLSHAADKHDGADPIRFHTLPGRAFPPADVLSAEPAQDGRPARMTTTVMGLVGPSGVLPGLYDETLSASVRYRSRALHDFLDMLAQRLTALFARAGAKYRLHRALETSLQTIPPAPDAVSGVLLSLTGYGTPHLVSRLLIGADPLLHYAGLFSAHPRSADRLASLVADWLGRPVEVEQFAGAWLPLAADELSALPIGRAPGQYNQLGVNATAGVRAWDVQARVVLHVGPLDRADFEALLPGKPRLRRLVSLVRAFLGFETAFTVNPILAAHAIPGLLLTAGADLPPRVSWNTWLPPPAGGLPSRDGTEALFEAELVETEGQAGALSQ
jgi:type VI secretion system protein ImpH